jgi:hypothetical protein
MLSLHAASSGRPRLLPSALPWPALRPAGAESVQTGTSAYRRSRNDGGSWLRRPGAGIFLSELRLWGVPWCQPIPQLGHFDGGPGDDQEACHSLFGVAVSCWPSRCSRHGRGIRRARRVCRPGRCSSWLRPRLPSRLRVSPRVPPRVRASPLCPSRLLPRPPVLPSTVFGTGCCASTGCRRFGPCSVAWLPVACLPMAGLCVAWTAGPCGTLVDRRRGCGDGDTDRLDPRGSGSVRRQDEARALVLPNAATPRHRCSHEESLVA